MPEVGGISAIDAAKRPGLRDEEPAKSTWLGSLAVLVLLALPTALTSLAITIVIYATIWWQRMEGMRVAPPSGAAFTAMAFGFYAIATWISVLAAWRWSSRRRFAAEVFAFRRLTWADAAITAAGFLAAFFGAAPLTRLIGVLIGSGAHGRPLNLHEPSFLALMMFATVVTAPFGEEVLFRGLLIAWLRRLRWPMLAVWLGGSLAFAAIHLPIYGLVWSVTMFFFGGMILAIRLWRRSLTPCWLIHLLFNVSRVIILPLLPDLARALGQ